MAARSNTQAVWWLVKRPMGQSLLLCGAYCGLHHHVVVATTNAILCVRAAGGFFVTHPTCPFHCSARCCRGIFFNPGFLWTGVQGLLRVSPILITLVSRLPIRGSRSSHCPDQVWVSCTLIRIFNALELDSIGHCCFGCHLCDTGIRLPRGFLHFQF